MMQDKTTLGISDTFREYIEALVEEVVINGEPFEAQKKWLRKNSEAEGVSYEAVESNLNDLFEAIKELEGNESKVIERTVRFLAKECYLSEDLLNKLIDNAATIRRQKEEAERREKKEREKKAQEEAEIKARKEQDRIAKEKAQWHKKFEAERKTKEEAERLALAAEQARKESERKAREERGRRAREEAEEKAKEKEEELKTLGLLNELKERLHIYSDNLKKQTTPFINPINESWSAIFVEQLRQAYSRKDLAFLDNAFSSNAQITTGAYEKSSNNLRYRSQGKQQYMANLKYIFEKKRTIDVKFGSDNLTGLLYASADGRCQVLRLLQTWNSDNYSDTGYLFLVLFADQNGPKVYVRAWQPQFVNGRHITLQELYGINNVTGLV